MANTLFRIINPAVRWLLRSPFHGLMSQNTLLVEFTGRKSGRALSTPISYHRDEKGAHCFTSRSFGWWRNLTTGQPVRLTIRGQSWQSTPVVEASDNARKATQLEAFLRAVPRDAAHAGVSLDKQGNPDIDEIHRVVPDMIYLQFLLENIHE